MGWKKLSPKHHELAVMTTACGKSPTEISEKLGMHKNSVHRLLRDQAILAVVSDGRRQIDGRVIVEHAERINQLTPLAFNRMESILEAGPPGVATGVAADVLDRNPDAP
jgi:hypothetical protein